MTSSKMTDSTPTIIRNSLNVKKSNKAAKKKATKAYKATIGTDQGKNPIPITDATAPSDPSTSTDADSSDSACYSMENVDSVSTPILLQPTLNDDKSSSGSKDAIAPKEDGNTEVITKAAGTKRYSAANPRWARHRHRLLRSGTNSEPQKEATEVPTTSIKEPTSQVPAVVSQDNGVSDKDNKPPPVPQHNDATEKGKSPLPVVVAQDNSATDKGKKPLTTDSVRRPSRYLSPTCPSKDEKSSGPDSDQPASESKETAVVSKMETVTTQTEDHVSSALKANSSASRSSQSTEATYYTAPNGDAMDSAISTRPPTPDLIPDFPTMTPHASSPGHRLIVDAERKPIENPKPHASSSLKVLHSNNQSTIEPGSSSASSSTQQASTSPSRSITGSTSLPKWPPLAPVPRVQVPNISDILTSSSQYAVVYNRLIKEREKLIEKKREYRNYLESHSDRMGDLRRSFVLARSRLDNVYKVQDEYTRELPETLKNQEMSVRNNFYLYGKRAMQTTDNLGIIWSSMEDINNTLLVLDEEVHTLQNAFRNRTDDSGKKKKMGCLSCFKKIGKLFKFK
ncbi:hypothetical protein K501DRAFT_330659 [Backusella circina FSU 941]|nr:hypothetical protein K501DRAFT_330659 [Backusella circina FSU 941]